MVNIMINIDAGKKKKFQVACLNNDENMAKVLRKFIAKFIRDPKAVIEYLDQ